MRYQVFNTRADDAQPVFSAPWYWLAFTLANLCSSKWDCCRLFDLKTGETPMEWVRARKPLSLDSNSATFSFIKVGEDGSRHELLFGQTRYGKGHAPKCGHRPITIIEVEGGPKVVPPILDAIPHEREGQ